ncbi:hypothetical protein FKM82_018239 [Ascaphus truei]
MPSLLEKARQNFDINCVPRSETMEVGIPWMRNTSLVKISARVGEEGSPLSGTKWACFEKRSTMTKMVFIPLEGGRSTMKSIEICDHGRSGTGKGMSKPEGL